MKKGVFYNVGKEITIETNRPISAIVDGEITTSTPLHITVRHKGITITINFLSGHSPNTFAPFQRPNR